MIEYCTRERAVKIFKFYKVTIVTVFAAFYQQVPIACKSDVFSKEAFIIHEVICLIFGKGAEKPYSFFLLQSLDSPFARKW